MGKKLILLIVSLCLMFTLASAGVCAAEPSFDNTRELAQYLLECANDLDTELSFSYTSKLDGVANEVDTLTDLLANCGMYEWYYSINDRTRHIEISQIEYRVGFKIARLVRTDRKHLLTSQEEALLMEAEWLVEEARMYAPSPFDLIVRLHDAVCYHAGYVQKGGQLGTWDTAFGVLALGEADCDGYADAFYLVASLAGFDVGLQRGQARGGSHIWNVLKWEGEWYQVDTTLDDMEYSDDPTLTDYRYLMAGRSLMNDHSWDVSLSPYDQAVNTDWDMYYYTTDSTGLTYGAYYENTKDAASYIVYKRGQTGDVRLHVMVNGSYADGVAFNDRLAEAGMTGRWMTWARQVNEYTCFTVLMLE